MKRLGVGLLLVSLAMQLQAQSGIVRDGSVGAPVNLQPISIDGVIEIDESMGLRPGGGVNLLHSFLTFDVASGDTALFSADPSLTTLRIISRVTGGSASQVFGAIASTVPGADLYLLNPGGIVFGPDASIDTQGSFYGSTANSLSMLADDPSGALTFTSDVRLAFAEPQTFGFLDTPAGIVVDGSMLSLTDGATLSLSGAQVTLQQGAGIAGASVVELIATGEATVLPADLRSWQPENSSGSLLLDGVTVEAGGSREGQIFLGSNGDLTLRNTTLSADFALGGGGGGGSGGSGGSGGGSSGGTAIALVAGGTATLRNSQVMVDADGGRTSGAVMVAGDQVELTGSGGISTGPCEGCEGGAGGAITITAAADLTLRPNGSGDAPELVTSTASDNNAGDITLQAGRLFEMDAGSITSFTLDSGSAGSIMISAPVIELANGAFISSASGPADIGGGGGGSGGGSGGGDGGSGGGSGGDGGGSGGGSGGDGGGSGGGSGGGDGGSGGGSGGDGGGSGGGSGGDGGGSGGGSGGSGGSSGGDSNTGATGAGGDVRIVATERITTRLNVNIGANSNAGGDAGELLLSAPVIELLEGTRIASAASASGDAGTIRIRGSNRVELSGTNNPADPNRNRGTRITASSAFTASGNAGSIDIAAGQLVLADGARISSSTSGVGDGGFINIEATSGIAISGARGDGSGSSIRAATEVEEGEAVGSTEERNGNAGQIRITSPSLSMAPGTEIRSTTSLPGTGGLIDLDVADIRLNGALIKAGSVGTGSGDAGNVFIGLREDGTPARYPLQQLTLLDSSIETSADDAGGGDIVIRGLGSIRLDNSGIDASDTASDGGNVDIVSTKDIVVANNSRILARAAIAGGDGGVIEIETDALVVSPDSQVIAENEVIIRSPETNIEAEVTELPETFQDSGQLFSPMCAVRTGAESIGSFTVDARPAIPVSPLDVVLVAATGTGRESNELEMVEDAFFDGRFDEVLSLTGVAATDADKRASDNSDLLGFRASALAAAGSAVQADATLARALKLSAGDAAATIRVQLHQANQLGLRGDYAGARLALTAARRQVPDAPQLAPQVYALSAGYAATPAAGREFAREALTAAPTVSGPARIRLEIYLAGIMLAQFLEAGDSQLLQQARAQLLDARDAAEKLKDTRLAAFAYAGLSDIYLADGQSASALGLIRAAIRAGGVDASDALFAWYQQEARLLLAAGDLDGAIEAFANGATELEAVRPMSRSRFGPADIGFRDIYTDYVDALLSASVRPGEQQQRLSQARFVVERFKQSELQNYFRDECVAALASQAESLDAIDARTAIVYPILLPDRLELLVSQGARISRYTVAVTRESVLELSRNFRDRLEVRTTNEYLPYARQMFDLLVRPYIEDVENAGVDTLVFVPDAALHGVAVAALNDGREFLIEKFAIAITPGLTLIAPAPIDTDTRTVLLAGLSQSQPGYDELPHVPVELADIQSLIGGELLLDEDFNAQRFRNHFVSGQPGIVHVASHAVFGGSGQSSYLLAHDEQLSIDQLHLLVSEARFRDPLELLTLSACETAAGDERAALGLSGTAIRAGARSALGTLWTVSDEASRRLIVEFYRQLASSNVSKAQALRGAQLMLADGSQFRHPYYWSPYLMISNWL
jgi:filamentous hemagglutinin family protein